MCTAGLDHVDQVVAQWHRSQVWLFLCEFVLEGLKELLCDMSDVKTELSYYTHCLALLFLPAQGLTGLMQDVVVYVLRGKMSFSGDILHKKRSSNPHPCSFTI